MAFATVTVLVALLAASWIIAWWLPAAWQQVVPTPLGYLAPISYLVTAACMTPGDGSAERHAGGGDQIADRGEIAQRHVHDLLPGGRQESRRDP